MRIAFEVQASVSSYFEIISAPRGRVKTLRRVFCFERVAIFRQSRRPRATARRREPCVERKAKLALLLVVETNPREVLTREEAAVIFGISRNTLQGRAWFNSF